MPNKCRNANAEYEHQESILEGSFLLSLRHRFLPSPHPEAERLFVARSRCETLRNNTRKSRTTLAVRFYCSYPTHTQADLRQLRKSAPNKLTLESDWVR